MFSNGGPLITLHGRVVGITRVVAEGAENIGFALPVNVLKRDLIGVQENGKITYPFLGIRYIMIAPEIEKELQLKMSTGARIRGDGSQPAIISDSPASSSGLKSGDIILKINGIPLTLTHPLGAEVQKHAPGERIRLEVVNYEGAVRNVEVILGEFDG